MSAVMRKGKREKKERGGKKKAKEQRTAIETNRTRVGLNRNRRRGSEGAEDTMVGGNLSFVVSGRRVVTF